MKVQKRTSAFSLAQKAVIKSSYAPKSVRENYEIKTKEESAYLVKKES